MGILSPDQAEDFSTTDESRFDFRLLGIMLLICGIGLVNIFSATSSGTAEGIPSWTYIIRQSIFFVGGISLIGMMMLLDYRLAERVAYIIYGLNLTALVAVEFIGVLRLGARRWLDLGFMSYQPSETMKTCVILALAKFFHERSASHRLDFKDLLVPGAIVGVPALLTIAQPDLGTGGHIAMIGGAIILFMGIRTRVVLSLLVLGVVTFPLAWQYGLKPYQKDRVRTFIDPMADPQGEGYNAIQSMIAVGSGELIGKGFQKGTQTQLDFTPEEHTDFIFTVLSEEWGFLGAVILLSLYFAMLYRCLRIASLARDKFGALICVGVIAMLTSQILINLAMVMGLFPIVGIPLPMFSYGGTSMLTVCFGLGLILNVGYRRTIF
jgi:rod shape determining protein RodA